MAPDATHMRQPEFTRSPIRPPPGQSIMDESVAWILNIYNNGSERQKPAPIK